MECIKFRNLHDLHWNKIILTCCFAVICFALQAQYVGKGNYNYKDFQNKPYYFGFTLGINSSGYQINQSRDFINNDSIRIVESDGGVGFNLHIITNLKIGEYFDFRFLPGFAFSERNIAYTSNIDDGISTSKIESVFIEAPLQIRFKSAPYKDKRAFVVAGLKYAYDVQAKSNTRIANSVVSISPHDFQLEVGAGMQFFMPFFIFSPEIKFSRGISNSIIFNGDLKESRVLESINSSIFTVSFHFEG